MIKLQCSNCGARIKVEKEDTFELKSGNVVIKGSASNKYVCAGCGTEYLPDVQYKSVSGFTAVVSGKGNVVVQGNGNVVATGGGVVHRGNYKGNIVL